MEELRTTEVLDKEILEDARKKAFKILKTADDTLAVQKLDWEKKEKKALSSIQRTYAARLKKTEGEIYARLPLDKRRLRSETAEGFLQKAMKDFLRSQKRETLLSVLGQLLRAQLKAFAEGTAFKDAAVEGVEVGEAEIRYAGMDLSETKALLQKAMNGLVSKSGNAFDSGFRFSEETQSFEFPSVIINTKAIKIGASVEGAAAALLKEKRAELAAALLGEGVLDD